MRVRYAFIVPGRPVPAVRMTRGGKHVTEAMAETRQGRAKARQREAHVVHREAVGWYAVAAKVKPLAGLVRLSATFWMQPQGRRRPPDIKNLITLLEDGLTGIAWGDDWQVAEYGRMRRLVVPGCEERTDVEIEPLEGSW